MAGAGAALAFGARPLRAATPKRADLQHIILVMMENRSFDHFIGWVPGADGKQAGLTFPDRLGQPQPTAPLAPDYQGWEHSDPDHSYEGGRVEYDDGACDGWLRAGDNDNYSIGYYTEADLPFFSGAVRNWLTCDGYFAAILGPTFPNRLYQHAAQTDRLDDSPKISSLPTIWDRLAARGLQGRYYFSDVPFTALWGNTYRSISQPIDEFFAACQAGTLPQVAFVDPQFISEDAGTSNDDHPFADIRDGQAFLNSVYEAVVTGPAWPKTILVINYDEWGEDSSITFPPWPRPFRVRRDEPATRTAGTGSACRASSFPHGVRGASSGTACSITPRCCG
jgi:phospholipase C